MKFGNESNDVFFLDRKNGSHSRESMELQSMSMLYGLK